MPTSPVEGAADAQLTQPETGLPEWLGEASPTTQQNVQDKEGLSAAAGGVLAPSRSPENPWGQAQGLDASQSTGTRDLLLGLHGILPVAGLVSQPQSGFTPRSQAPSGDSAGSQARVFADIVTQPPQPHPPGPPLPKGRRSSRVARLIVYAALVALVALPLLRGKPVLSRKVAPNQALADLHETIEALSAGATALVAFDYDPSSSEEMDLLAKAVVAHLLDRNARVVAVSLLPAGAATAQGLLEEVMAEHPEYGAVYGQHYANLGFVPGQAVAVRLLNRALSAALPRDYFGNPLEDLPVMEGVYAVKDLALIIELAAEQDSLRWWIEQAATPSGVPLGAGVSASVEPLARPYYQTGTRQLRGLAAGVVGAAAYEALRSSTDRPPDALGVRLDSQLAGHLLLILVILAGNGVHLAKRWSGRKS